MADRAPVVVVGASAAGLTAAETVRAEGFAGQVVLVGEEDHLPYDRPPLSKQQLTAEVPPPVCLTDQRRLRNLDIDLLLGCRASGLDVEARRVLVGEDRVIEFGQLVIATGVRPRHLSDGHELRGVHTLRSLDDATELRASLDGGRRVVVVGGGFLGAEVAASARSRGLEVTWLFPEDAPMSNVLGPQVGEVFWKLHRDAGVVIRPGASIRRVTGEDGVVTGVENHAGQVDPADVVVVCIGSTPNVEWLASSGLGLTNGVDCDSFGRAAEGIYAAGDVANWLHPRAERRIRVEHRTNATDQARVVAHNIVHGPERTSDPVPYFWTDQYDARLQVYGFPARADEFTVKEGRLADGKFAGVWTSGGRAVGVGGIGQARAVRELRQLLSAPAD